MKRIITALVFLVGASQAQAITKHMKHLKGAYVGVGQEYVNSVQAIGIVDFHFWSGKVGYTKVRTKKIGYGIEGVYGVAKLDPVKNSIEKGVSIAVKPILTYGLNRKFHVYAGAKWGQVKANEVPSAGRKASDKPLIFTSLGGQVGLVARVYRNLSVEGEVGYHQWTLGKDYLLRDGQEQPVKTASLGLRYAF